MTSRNTFRLKPIIDIYSRIILNDTSDENINKNFELAMIGMITFLNAKDVVKIFNKDTKSGNIVYKYNPDYKEINELKIFMTTEYNKDKDLLYTDSLKVENEECLIDKLCYTTSEDLKKFYMTSTKTIKSEKENENKKERENKKGEVKNEILDLNELLDLIFIANLIYTHRSNTSSINAIINDLIKTSFPNQKVKYRGLIQRIINKKNLDVTIDD